MADTKESRASLPPAEAAQDPPHQAGSPAAATEQPASAVPEETETEETERTEGTEAPPPPSEILPASHWAQIPLADEPQDNATDAGDGDSAFGDVASSTASLSESIMEYRNIHGRTFHSNVGVAESW